MRHRMMLIAALSVGLAGAAGFCGGRAVGAAQAANQYDASVGEMLRTESYLRGHLTNAVNAYQRIAGEANLQNLDERKAERERAIQQAIQPLQEDLIILSLHAHLMVLDRAIDESGGLLEQFLQEKLLTPLGYPADEVAARRRETKLSFGNLALGFVIANAANTGSAELFQSKGERSWAQVMRERGVTIGQIFERFQRLDG